MESGSRRTRMTGLKELDNHKRGGSNNGTSVGSEIRDKRSHAEKPAASLEIDGTAYDLIDIRATGDVLLDVTFENQRSRVLLMTPAAVRPMSLVKPTKPTDSRVLYRVRLETLQKTSKYFELLLASNTFEESKMVRVVFAALDAKGICPSEADAKELPRIKITDDDEATHMAGREAIFGDLLRMMHGAEVSTRFTMPYLAVLSIMADRFDCTSVVGRCVRAAKKMAWPQTYGGISMGNEELIRQKILIAWLLEDQPRLASSTRELIMRGSRKWTGEAEKAGNDSRATWWDLQDGLEAKLQHRRNCILSTLASLQKQFLMLYTSRERQCKLYYESSAACDSYQLGEMVKFFSNKALLALSTPLCPYDDSPDVYSGDIENLLTVFRQCPSYQIDKNHAHCGLRARIIPALDYIQVMLTSGIGIDRRGWKNDRPGTSWETSEDGEEESFKFSKGVMGDSRLKVNGLIVGSNHAKAVFAASSWDWIPGDSEAEKVHTEQRSMRLLSS